MVKFRLVALLNLFFIAALLSACQARAAATIQVELDRDVIEQGESFTVTFSSSGDVDGDPDFSPLQKDFRIAQQSQSSNIQIINGSMSSNKQWVLMLMPKTTGKLVIPSISFGSDKSAPGFITVKKTTASSSSSTDHGLMYMEVDTTPKQAYVQSQVLFTVRIYHAISLVNASLTDVTLSDKNAMLVKLGDAVTYQKYVNGRRYKVIEKRFAVFPQASGTLTINPVQFEGQFVNSRGMLSQRVISTQAVNINVKPEAAAWSAKPGATWLPAKSFTVMDSWAQDKPKFQVGEPVTRTITMVADGLMGEQLPPLKFDPIADLKQYPDQPQITNNKDSNGVTGARQEKIAFIPTHSGTYHLPAMEIAWWDTVHDRQQIAKINAIDITVAPSADQAGNQNSASANTAPANTAQSPITTPQSSATTLKNKPAAATSVNAPAVKQESSVWFWVSLGLMLVWLATMSLWWWQRKRSPATSVDERNPQSQKLKPLERELKQICDRQDAKQAKDKLMQWAQANWRDHAPTSLGELGRHCDAELARELASLNQVLYSHATNTWDGPSFWRVFEAHKPALNQQKKANVTTLEPLFRHSA